MLKKAYSWLIHCSRTEFTEMIFYAVFSRQIEDGVILKGLNKLGNDSNENKKPEAWGISKSKVHVFFWCKIVRENQSKTKILYTIRIN